MIWYSLLIKGCPFGWLFILLQGRVWYVIISPQYSDNLVRSKFYHNFKFDAKLRFQQLQNTTLHYFQDLNSTQILTWNLNKANQHISNCESIGFLWIRGIWMPHIKRPPGRWVTCRCLSVSESFTPTPNRRICWCGVLPRLNEFIEV